MNFKKLKTEYLKVFWKKTITRSEKNFLEALCIGLYYRLNNMEAKFSTEVQQLQQRHTGDRFKDWLVKLLVHLEKKI